MWFCNKILLAVAVAMLAIAAIVCCLFLFFWLEGECLVRVCIGLWSLEFLRDFSFFVICTPSAELVITSIRYLTGGHSVSLWMTIFLF